MKKSPPSYNFRIAFLLLIVFLIHACQKLDTPLLDDNTSKIEKEQLFFNEHLPDNPLVLAVKNWMYRHHKLTPLVDVFVQRAGFQDGIKRNYYLNHLSQQRKT